MAALDWFRSSLGGDAPPPGLSPPLQALWYAGKTDFDIGALHHVFDRIGAGADGGGRAVIYIYARSSGTLLDACIYAIERISMDETPLMTVDCCIS